MTKKDYIKLANIIRITTKYDSLSRSGKYLDYTDFLDGLCEVLISDNPNFDVDKFVKACNE